MKRFFAFFTAFIMVLGIFLCGCGDGQIDRNKELKQVLDTCDSKWSQSFPTGTASFDQVEDYIAGWGSSAGLEVTKIADHYMVLTNPATKGNKKTPSVTVAVTVDPASLRNAEPLLSLGMTSILGPTEHGRLRLIVTESASEGSGQLFPGAEQVKSKYLKCDHFIYLYGGDSAMVYTDGPLTSVCNLSSSAKRKKPDYTNAYELTVTVPERLDPYDFDKEHYVPNPINVLGDLLASAKSAGRLFEIASFTCEDNGQYLPSEAKAVVVIDDNNVEAFQKRFDKSLETLTDSFKDLDLGKDKNGTPLADFTYTMAPTELPDTVLRQTVSDNIISLMYTLQTGIHLQDEESGAITAASYIRSISTKGGSFRLAMDLRSRDDSSMEEMSGNYLITSGLCDVKYTAEDPHRLWSSETDSSLAAWFIATVNDEDDDTSLLQSSECDLLAAKRDGLDMISYRFDEDHPADALDNLLNYASTLSAQD